MITSDRISNFMNADELNQPVLVITDDNKYLFVTELTWIQVGRMTFPVMKVSQPGPFKSEFDA